MLSPAQYSLAVQNSGLQHQSSLFSTIFLWLGRQTGVKCRIINFEEEVWKFGDGLWVISPCNALYWDTACSNVLHHAEPLKQPFCPCRDKAYLAYSTHTSVSLFLAHASIPCVWFQFQFYHLVPIVSVSVLHLVLIVSVSVFYIQCLLF